MYIFFSLAFNITIINKLDVLFILLLGQHLKWSCSGINMEKRAQERTSLRCFFCGSRFKSKRVDF